MSKTKNNLIWFRNDLRTHDNSVLAQACKTGQNVIAVYCFEPRFFKYDNYGFKKTEKFRAKFLIETVSELKSRLLNLNIELFVFFETPELCIPKLSETFSISDIYYQNEWTPEDYAIELALKAKLTHVKFYGLFNQFLFHPEDLNFEIKKTPDVFTEFRKKLEKQHEIRKEVGTSKFPSQKKIKNLTTIPTLQDLGFSDFSIHQNTAFPFKGGEISALKRLKNYVFETKKIGYYKKTRNGLLGKDYSSKFSPWLANGSLSPKTIYWNMKAFETKHYKNQSTYWLIFELIWRDYFKYISIKYGNKIFQLDGILQNRSEWLVDKTKINRWIFGTTASDFVNANMIELKETGWMSNRGRQNVASYFAKTLNLDWRIGAAYFESLLLDYDVHSNYGNWMYVAGVGNDPRDRNFNVELQSQRYDPNGTYRRLWLQKTLLFNDR